MTRTRTPRLLAASALGLALVAVPALPAMAGDAAPTVTKDGSTYTLKVLETDDGSGDTFIPKGGEPVKEEPSGPPKAGDGFGFAAVLTQDGTKVGTDGGTCTVQSVDLDAQTSVNHCRVTMKFADGSITVEDTVTFSDEQSTFKVAIAAGTGAYDGIKGTLTVHDRSDSGSSGEGSDNGPSLSDLTFSYTLPAAGSEGPAATKDGSSTVITATEHPTGQKFVPKGGEPQDFPADEEHFQPKVGDGVQFTSDLLQDGSKVGSLVGHCTFTDVTTHTDHCLVTVTFPGGTLLAEDDIGETDEPFDVAIVGGTGAYAGAKGHVHVVPTKEKNSDDSTDTFTFTTDGSQVSEVPSGGAATGGGLDTSSNSTLVIGLGGLVALAGFGALAGGRALGRREH